MRTPKPVPAATGHNAKTPLSRAGFHRGCLPTLCIRSTHNAHLAPSATAPVSEEER
jgi:hypothetical protein